jgi:hypothetical protein
VLLQAVALYFDRLYLLDPFEAVTDPGTEFGKPAESSRDVKLLEDEALLERISPAEVLGEFGPAVLEAIRSDLDDSDFVALCRNESKAQDWILSLAKVPEPLRQGLLGDSDRAMQKMLGGKAEEARVFSEAGYTEIAISGQGTVETDPGAIRRLMAAQARVPVSGLYAEVGYVGPESRLTGPIEYRFGRYSVEAGEAIMLNHALVASLRLTGATPITDDPFHRKAMTFKLERALAHPAVQDLVDSERVRSGLLALAVLTDAELELPAMAPQVPLERVLEFRDAHAAELDAVRLEFGAVAAEMEATGLTTQFTHELKRTRLPSLRQRFAEAGRARDAWLRARKTELAEVAGGLGVSQLGAGIGLAYGGMPPLALGIAAAAGLAHAAFTAAPAVRRLRAGPAHSDAVVHYLLTLR